MQYSGLAAVPGDLHGCCDGASCIQSGCPDYLESFFVLFAQGDGDVEGGLGRPAALVAAPDTLVSALGSESGRFTLVPGSLKVATYKSSTLLRAHWVLRKNFNDDLIDGSLLKQLIRILLAISSQP